MNECDIANHSRTMKHNFKKLKGRIISWKFCQLIIVLLKEKRSDIFDRHNINRLQFISFVRIP